MSNDVVEPCVDDVLVPIKALEEMAARNDGKVTCPRSNQSCDFSVLKKVYVS